MIMLSLGFAGAFLSSDQSSPYAAINHARLMQAIKSKRMGMSVSRVPTFVKTRGSETGFCPSGRVRARSLLPSLRGRLRP